MTRTYLKTGLLAIILLCLGLSAFPGKRKIRIRSRYLNIPYDSVRADIPRTADDTICRIYSGQTVRTTVTIYNTDSIFIGRTAVKDSGNLRVTGGGAVIVPSEMEVEIGGEMQINSASQNTVIFSYDSVGNRYRRLKQ